MAGAVVRLGEVVRLRLMRCEGTGVSLYLRDSAAGQLYGSIGGGTALPPSMEYPLV